MMRQVDIFAVSCIVCILIAGAFADGLYPVPTRQYDELASQLRNSNMERTFGSAKVEVLDVKSVSEQVVDDKNYLILATILINGRIEKCCFVVHHFFPPQQRFFIISADVGVRKCWWLKFK